MYAASKFGPADAAAAEALTEQLAPSKPEDVSKIIWTSTRDFAERGNVPPAPALDPKEFKPFKLAKVERISPDTKRYTFEFPDPDAEPGLRVSSALLVRATLNGKEVVRPYTPITHPHHRGSMSLLIKSYEKGNVSKYFDSLVDGSEVYMKGPIHKIELLPNQYDSIGMLAGGTGITPMYQVLNFLLNEPRDRTQFRLLFANRSPADILLRTELDALQAVHHNFKVMYTVDNVPAGTDWKGPTGHVSAEMIRSFLPPPTKDGVTNPKVKILVCGPPGFMKHLSGEKKAPTDQGPLTGLLADLQYTPDQVYKY